MRLVRAAVVAVPLAVAALTITLALAFPPCRHSNPSLTIGNLARGGLARAAAATLAYRQHPASGAPLTRR
jgi:hypothetical protein